jgi:SHS2 domain-containing protein
MESGYLLLDHPADLGIEAYGKTLSEAFEQAACGLTSVILDPDSVLPAESMPVRIEAGDQQQLLVRWLTEVLYLYDGLKFAPREFKIGRLSARLLEARVRGEPYNLGRHTARLDVKAITYHQLTIRTRPSACWLQVFLDI